MDVEFLNVLLSGCKNLPELRYEPMDRAFLSLPAEKKDVTQYFTTRHFITAVSIHTPLLGELNVAFMLCDEVEAWEADVLHGLERLTNLRKLTTDCTPMTGMERLPVRL